MANRCHAVILKYGNEHWCDLEKGHQPPHTHYGFGKKYDITWVDGDEGTVRTHEEIDALLDR